MLSGWGVRDVIVNCHHRAGDLVEYVTHGHRPERLRVALSFEPRILGTGGALRRAEWFFDDGPFWLINADIVADVRPAFLMREYRRHRPLGVLWMHSGKGPRTVLLRDGWVSDFQAGSPDVPGACTFCGLHLLDRRIFEYLPDAGYSSIVSAYERAIRSGERMAGVKVRESFWADTGTPADYLAAHADYAAWAKKRGAGLGLGAHPLRDDVKVEGFSAVADDVRIGPGAYMRNSVLWPGVRVGARARLENAIVGSGVRVNGAVRHVVTRAETALDVRERAVLRRRGWREEDVTVETWSPRGSARQYLRLTKGRDRVVLVRYDGDRLENTLFGRHARFLRHLGLRVPRVLYESRGPGLLLLEDLGDRSLQGVVQTSGWARAAPFYRQALRGVARLHDRGAAAAGRAGLPLMPAFGPELFRWERELFTTQYMRGVLGLEDRMVFQVEKELQKVSNVLGAQPAVLIHRDLQSSNILIRGRQVAFIDFQGMRRGPAAYDIASLLCDPYVEMPMEQQRVHLAWYGKHVRGQTFPENVFWCAAIQRLAQAIGAYIRLSEQPGGHRFRPFVSPALRMMRRALDRTAPMPGLRETIRCGLKHERA